MCVCMCIVCVCVCVHACIHVLCVCMHMCACAYVSVCVVSVNIGLVPQVPYTLIFDRGFLTETRDLLSRLVWLVSELQGCSCLHLQG